MERALQRESETVKVSGSLSPLLSSSSLSSLEGRAQREMIKRWKPLKVQGRGALSSISRQSCWLLHVHYCKPPILASNRLSRARRKRRDGGATNFCIILFFSLSLLSLVVLSRRKISQARVKGTRCCHFDRKSVLQRCILLAAVSCNLRF